MGVAPCASAGGCLTILLARFVRGIIVNQNTNKTQCKNGHDFKGDNLVMKVDKHGNNHRICRTCRNADSSARDADIRRLIRDVKDPVRRNSVRLRRRKSQLKSIGWTPELFEKTFEEQDKKCAICRKPLLLDKYNRSLYAHADHEHVAPPKPRGILCQNCNLGIGNLQENLDIMEAAIAYVKKYKEG